MGRSEADSSPSAIAFVAIAGMALLLLLGCGGLAAVGWLFTARSAPAPANVQIGPSGVVAEPEEESDPAELQP